MNLLNNTTCPRCKKGTLVMGRCGTCNCRCEVNRRVVWWVDAVEVEQRDLAEWAKANGRVWCEESGEWVVEAIEPPKGSVTRIEEAVEMAEAAVELAINPVEVLRDGVWGFLKGTLFGWLRKNDKSTYRP